MDELVSSDDVVVSGCGLGSGRLGISPPHVGCHSWFLGSGFLQGWFCWLLLALCRIQADARHPGRYGPEGHLCSEVVAHSLSFRTVRWSMFPLCGRADSQVLPWRRRSCSHSCSSLRNQILSTTLRILQSLVRCVA